MNRSGDRRILAAAMLGWIGVGVYGVWEIVGKDAGDGWERPYALFSISLLLAVLASTTAAWGFTHASGRHALRSVGLGVGIVAAASSVVAWALPLWATLLAGSCALLAVAGPRLVRGGVALLAAAQVVGIAAMIGATEAEVGRQDSYGDYPAAFGLGNVVIAAGSVLGLTILARTVGSARLERAMTVGRESPATV